MISIIVPIYKVEKFLPKCIESLLNQTYRDIQIILVDDGSPDNSGEICDRYSAKDSRIKVIHQANRGVSAARNAGLDIAEGDYIGFCDPDDFVAPEMYKKMIEAMEREKVDLVVCGYDYYDEQYRKDGSRHYHVKDNETLTKEEIYSRLSDMPPTIRHGVVNKLFRKTLLTDIKFEESLHSAEDGNFVLDYLRFVKSAIFIHEPLYLNLVRSGSATHGGLNISSLRDSFKVHDRMYRETTSLFPRLKGHALAFLLDVCTLKYNEAKSHSHADDNAKKLLKEMKRFIGRKALLGCFNPEIYWKTKLYYLLIWLRK